MMNAAEDFLQRNRGVIRRADWLAEGLSLYSLYTLKSREAVYQVCPGGCRAERDDAAGGDRPAFVAETSPYGDEPAFCSSVSSNDNADSAGSFSGDAPWGAGSQGFLLPSGGQAAASRVHGDGRGRASGDLGSVQGV